MSAKYFKKFGENKEIIKVDVERGLSEYFVIPTEIKNFLDRVGYDNVTCSFNKNGTKSLKIKNLTYYELDSSNLAMVINEHNVSFTKNRQKLSVENNINNNLKGEKTMKVSVRFMKMKNGKKSFFETYCRKEVIPKLLETTLNTKEEVHEKLESVLKEITNDRSSWSIEENTNPETTGFVIKNEFKKKNKETDEEYISHNIFFVNLYES